MAQNFIWFLYSFIIVWNSAEKANGDRWCVVSDEEAQKCWTMSSAFGAHGLTPKIECVQTTSERNCMRMVSEGDAEIATVSSLQVGLATEKFDLEGILAENYAATSFSVLPLDYYAIALSWANQNWTVNTLGGSRSCHSSILEPAGWSLPLSVLLQKNIMTPLDCTSPLISAANFFNQSCVPGAFSPEANPGNLNVSNLCSLCVGQEESFCEANSGELCYGEPGAFRCLTGFSRSKVEARADVAFLRHDTVLKMTVTQEELDQAVSRLDRFRLSNKRLRSDFVLLCPDGSRDVVENYHTCNYGKVPSSLVMVKSGNQKKRQIVDMILAGQKLFGDDYKNYFKMFDSKQLGMDQSDLIFSDKTVNLSVISPKEAKEWTKKLDMQLENQFKCPVPVIRWCVFSFAELEKCSFLDKSILVQTYYWRFRLKCVLRRDINSCFEAIAKGEADLISSEPGHAYTALYSHDLQVLSIIQNSDPNNEDYVIVLAKRNSDQSLFKFHDGAMPKVCLPWIDSAPYAFFMEFLNITKYPSNRCYESCDELTLLTPHVKQACVPGLLEGPRNLSRKRFAGKFCSLCSSPSEPCEANNDHIFFGSTGAFRCMNANYPNIAVTTARVLMDNTNMQTYNDWNWNLRRSLFHLLCPYFGKYFSDPHYFKQCNLGSLPPYVVLTRANISEQVRSVFFHFVKSLESIFTKKGWEKKPWLESVFRGNLRADLMFPEIGRGFLPAEKNYRFQDYPNFVQIMERRRKADALPFCNTKEKLLLTKTLVFMLSTLIINHLCF